MMLKSLYWIWFGEHICQLIISVDIDDINQMWYEGPEVVIHVVQVFGSGSHCGCFGIGKGSSVVFKSTAHDLGLSRSNGIPKVLHFLYQMHEWFDFAKRLTQTDLFGLGGAECSDGLEL